MKSNRQVTKTTIESLLRSKRPNGDLPRTTAKAQEMLVKAADALLREAFRRVAEYANSKGDDHVTMEHFREILPDLIIDFCFCGFRQCCPPMSRNSNRFWPLFQCLGQMMFKNLRRWFRHYILRKKCSNRVNETDQNLLVEEERRCPEKEHHNHSKYAVVNPQEFVPCKPRKRFEVIPVPEDECPLKCH
uniref:Centromere protein X n=1 Tax=Steinernema glaseri TaxID=37863 RepID=A0A1I7YED4_9BILA